MKWILKSLIRFYKMCLSPLIGGHCIFYPTCSTYMMQAIDKFGCFRGVWLGIKRIFRCNRWNKGGYDPVPDNPHGDIK